MARNPKTPAEWQDAVNAAEYPLLLDSARQYGLITGGPKVNTERASTILKQGEHLGYRPLPTGDLLNLYMHLEAS